MGMTNKLQNIHNWAELARQAKWSVTALAKLCEVSKDTLQRHLHQHTGQAAGHWLAELRQHQAIELLRDGSNIQETSICLGYKHQTNFTRAFKAYWGVCPKQHRLVPPKPKKASK
jgi:AraC family transcriptional activator of mtrCDE